MLIDWFTTSAQIVNFLILVWLLKRFLYKPILRAMDEREKRMVDALHKAEEQEAKAESERISFEKKSRELDEQKAQMLKDAEAAAGEERKKMVAAAREEVAGLETQWRTSIEQDKKLLFTEFSARIGGEIVAISRRVLSDLANVQLEQCITTRFVEELKSLSPTERERLRLLFINPAKTPIVVQSAFDLAENSRRQIQTAIQEQFGVREGIQFVNAPELVGGIELSANDHRISWSIQTYLSSLQQQINELMEKGELQLARSGA